VNLVVMVGADKGGVGKTTVTRALVEYLAARGTTPRLFDTQSPLGDLARFAACAEVVDVEKIAGQMRVFDAPAGVTLIDVRGGLLSPLLRSLDKVRLLEEVKSGATGLVLLHVIGPNVASLGEVMETAAQIGGGSKHFIVKNHINEGEFSEFDQDKRFAEMFAKMRDATIGVPHLAAEAAAAVQRDGCSFTDFAKDASKSRVLRGYVFDWLTATFREFDRVGLGTLIAPLVEMSGETPA
jgi:dethiobiotin synthetase